MRVRFADAEFDGDRDNEDNFDVVWVLGVHKPDMRSVLLASQPSSKI